eukprot:3517512-Amphidinium_carterae.1
MLDTQTLHTAPEPRGHKVLEISFRAAQQQLFKNLNFPEHRFQIPAAWDRKTSGTKGRPPATAQLEGQCGKPHTGLLMKAIEGLTTFPACASPNVGEVDHWSWRGLPTRQS